MSIPSKIYVDNIHHTKNTTKHKPPYLESKLCRNGGFILAARARTILSWVGRND